MPRKITPEQQEFMKQRRFLHQQRPHSMECFEGWAGDVRSLDRHPITSETIAYRELAVDMRDNYALNIIESFQREARR
jgi:hypothetical protein